MTDLLETSKERFDIVIHRYAFDHVRIGRAGRGQQERRRCAGYESRKSQKRNRAKSEGFAGIWQRKIIGAVLNNVNR